MPGNTLKDLLLVVIKDMEQYQDNAILVGGWLPDIYANYAWKNASDQERIMKTQDIDYAIRENYGFKGKTIGDLLSGKNGYLKESVSEVEDRPYLFVVKDGELKMKIDLISHEYMDPNLIAKVAGKDIEVAPIGNTDIMLDKNNIMAVTVGEGPDAVNVFVPVPAAYLYVKGLTCVERELKLDKNELKKGDKMDEATKNRVHKFKKDLWSVYYVAGFIPESDRKGLIDKLLSFKQRDPELFEGFKKNLKKYFKNEKSKGPTGIIDISDPMDPLIAEHMKKRVVNVVKQLLESVG